MEEYIQNNDYSSVNEEQNDPIQEDQEDNEIPGLNEISETDSIVSYVRMSERESHPE